MPKFKIDDRVRIRESADAYHAAPHGYETVIKYIDGGVTRRGGLYQVLGADGEWHTFFADELEPIPGEPRQASLQDPYDYVLKEIQRLEDMNGDPVTRTARGDGKLELLHAMLKDVWGKKATLIKSPRLVVEDI